MSRVVIVWKDNCPKCDYVKNIFRDFKLSAGIEIKYINGTASSGQSFITAHDINQVPVVVFYNNKGQVHKAKQHTYKSLNNEFKAHVGINLFKDFA